MSLTRPDLPPLRADLRVAEGAHRTAFVIWNPLAGSGLMKKRVDIDEVCKRFLDQGWSIATVMTRCPGDGTECARYAAAQGADVVVAMGGDGTINEVVQAVAMKDTPLGIIPVGTINVLAQELGLPSDPLKAIDRICEGQAVSIDLGKANGRYFTMMIGLGYDAESINALIPSLKQWTGPIAYWIAGFQSFVKHKSVRARLTVDDGRRTRRFRRLIYMMVISNTGMYAGGVLKFTPEASIRDGLLDACLIVSRRWYRAMFHIALTFFGKLRTVSDVEFFHAKSLTIRTTRPFPYQLDGDPAGVTPVTIQMVPLGLKVIAGPQFESSGAVAPS